MLKISQMARPELFIKDNHMKLSPWIRKGRYILERGKLDKNGFGDYTAFSVRTNNLTEQESEDGTIWHYVDVYFDLEEYNWTLSNHIFMVDGIVWVEAIDGGLQSFKVEKISESKYWAEVAKEFYEGLKAGLEADKEEI